MDEVFGRAACRSVRLRLLDESLSITTALLVALLLVSTVAFAQQSEASKQIERDYIYMVDVSLTIRRLRDCDRVCVKQVNWELMALRCLFLGSENPEPVWSRGYG